MDAALWMLWRLRLSGFLRRFGRNLRTVKGVLLTLVALLCFIPWLISVLFIPRPTSGFDPAQVQRFGPLILLVFAILTTMFSSGERALFFTPAEVAFLFPGPFTRRSLLVFKIIGVLFGCAFSGLFISLAFGKMSSDFLSAYVSITLVILFFQLLAMAVALASNTLAVFAVGFRRKAGLVGLVLLLFWMSASVGSSILSMPPADALKALEGSPAIRAATAPFLPFVSIYTAAGLSPEFFGWSAVCLGMIGALLWFVLAIDARYLETAAASSARIYEKIQKVRKGGGVAAPSAGPKSTRFRLAMFPSMKGIGPILWRQCLTAGREPLRVVLTWLFLFGLGGMMLYTSRNNPEFIRQSVFAVGGISMWMAMALSPLIAFDFRGDLDRMEELKTLPTHPISLVVGQLLTPVLVFVIPQWVLYLATSILAGGMGLEQLAAIGFVFPATFLLFGIENLLFLLFPTRATSANAADFTALGRQVLIMLAKLLGVAASLGISAMIGVGAFYLLKAPRVVCIGLALTSTIGFAMSIIPLVAAAFQRYDVARDTPA